MTKAECTVGLDRFGPGSQADLSDEEARDWCLSLTRRHGENFHVLTGFVPSDRVSDFAALYAFCRCADDLGDEAGSPERATELLQWWREELHKCFRGEARHPAFIALRSTVQKHELPRKPFDDLISAFELDQIKTRYATFEEVVGYCRLSADPVGRLVLGVLGEDVGDEGIAASDAICTALQLTNHWQDVRRDLVERNRIYIPQESWVGAEFERRLSETVCKGYAPDREFLAEWRATLRSLVDRTWPLFERGEALLSKMSRRNRPLIWLFHAGGAATLNEIEQWQYETCLVRPRVTTFGKATLLLRAKLASFAPRRRSP